MEGPDHTDSESYSTTKLRRVTWSKDLELFRGLLQDYRTWLFEHSEAADPPSSEVPAGLRRIDDEIAGLPGVYGPPRGDVILAEDPEGLAACGSLREFEPGVAEIKRVYVRADHRGPGFGPILTGALLDRARELGFERVRVDTLPTMYAAIEFYQEMGFKPIPAYWPNPVPGALFFEFQMAGGGRPPH